MTRPHFDPQPDNTFRIAHPPLYRSSAALLRKISAGEFDVKDAVSRLRETLSQYPWHFEAALNLAELYTAQGQFEKACDTRYKACQKIIDLLPDDEDEHAEPIALDFEYKDNQPILFLLHASAIDHFLIGDFEMAAGLLETLLDLDEEDHLDASQTLAYCYVALDERELFEDILPDLDDKSPEKTILRLWAGQRFDGKADPESIAAFKKDFPAEWQEFTAETHEVTDAYLADIDSERPSREARARLLWLRTEHLWKQFPAFIEALKA